MTFLLALGLATICVASCHLVMCPGYDDGLVGRIALVLMNFASGIGLVQFMKGAIDFNPVGTVMTLALALFLSRQMYFTFRCKQHKQVLYENK